MPHSLRYFSLTALHHDSGQSLTRLGQWHVLFLMAACVQSSVIPLGSSSMYRQSILSTMLDWRSPSCLCQQWCSCQAWEQHEIYGPLRHILCVGLHMFKCMLMHLPPMQNAYRNCTCSTNMLEGQAFLYAPWYLISPRWCTLTLNDLSKDSDALSQRNSVLSMHGINVIMVCFAWLLMHSKKGASTICYLSD
jgi:hypothetical protein